MAEIPSPDSARSESVLPMDKPSAELKDTTGGEPGQPKPAASDGAATVPAASPAGDSEQSAWASRLNREFRRRGWQWLSLGITLPFLAFNGLAAWQARSLTHYSQPSLDKRPLFAQPPLKRLGAFAFGVKIPRPENQYSPADIGLAFDSHRIDLGNGEFLDGWHVPAPAAKPEASTSKISDTETTPSQTKEDEAVAGGLKVVPNPIQVSDKQGMVLLFPAYAASKQTLLQEVKLLHRLGYATFAVDHRGVGDSSGNNTTLGRREAEDVAVTVDYVTQTFKQQPLAIYGRIMAAGTVLRAIAEYDLQLDALILEDPYAHLFTLTQTVVESVGLPRSPVTQMLTLWGRVLQGGELASYDPINYASAVSTPTLVLYGSDEAWVSLDEVVGIHSQLQGPKEIVGLASSRATPVSATASVPWTASVEPFLDEHLK